MRVKSVLAWVRGVQVPDVGRAPGWQCRDQRRVSMSAREGGARLSDRALERIDQPVANVGRAPCAARCWGVAADIEWLCSVQHRARRSAVAAPI